jgi:hypothetical protein
MNWASNPDFENHSRRIRSALYNLWISDSTACPPSMLSRSLIVSGDDDWICERRFFTHVDVPILTLPESPASMM